MARPDPTNDEVAQELEHIAELLEAQHADPHRVRSYRRGARRARELSEPLAAIVRRGDGEALRALPDIGRSLARLIEELVRTGSTAMRRRLEGEVAPEDVLERVPGIGHGLAERIVAQLDVRSLEDLELAAHDGRLDRVPGFGPRRVESVKATLAGLLGSAARRRARRRTGPGGPPPGQPAVEHILDVDAEYRRRAEEGTLRRIAPRRFNPEGRAWLPILHTRRGGWRFTALFSNTARAHELGHTRDWVVVYWEHDGEEGQATVVTAGRGPDAGRRVVRGREAECREIEARTDAAPEA